jgi:hypothetical protein
MITGCIHINPFHSRTILLLDHSPKMQWQTKSQRFVDSQMATYNRLLR